MSCGAGWRPFIAPRVQEFAEVTFQPHINSRSREMVRKVSNLTRYVRLCLITTQCIPHGSHQCWQAG